MKDGRKTTQIILLIGFISLVVWDVSVKKVNHIRYDGVWETFQKTNEFAPDKFPQNLSFEYPKSWPLSVSENGGAKPNLWDRKISLDSADKIFGSSEHFSIWWTKADSNWTEQDLVEWYSESISTNSSDNHLTPDSFNRVQIGVDGYPALKTNRKGWQNTIFLVLVDQDAYAFIYTVDTSRNYSRDIVDRFIGSIDFSAE